MKTDHAKVAASNEALSLEFGTQPLQLAAEPSKASKASAAARPPPPPPQLPAAAAAEAAAAEVKKRSAAEALAGLVAPASSAPQQPAAGGAAEGAAGAGGGVDPLSDYHRMKAKSNRLTAQDDERIRLFYLHGAQGNPRPEQREVKIKINEEEAVREDGSRVREALYLTLNYDSRKAVLVRVACVCRVAGAVQSSILWVMVCTRVTDGFFTPHHSTPLHPTVAKGLQAQDRRAMSSRAAKATSQGIVYADKSRACSPSLPFRSFVCSFPFFLWVFLVPCVYVKK